MFAFILLTVITGSNPAYAPEPAREEINLTVTSEGTALDVTVIKPKNHAGKLPAVVFVVGSGEGSTVAGYQPFTEFFFNQGLLKEEMALVYFDKRGLGKSEGTWYTTSFAQRALDTRNVAMAINELEFIDSDNIFVIGHSQGGWIVQLALAEYPDLFAGGISMAGPTFSVRRQLINDYMSGFICNDGLDEQQAEERATRKVRRDLFLVSLFGWTGNLRQLNVIKDFEAEPYLPRIERPLLLMFAENDPLVSPQWAWEALQTTFPDQLPENMEYYVAPGQEHSFKEAPACYRGNRRQLPYSDSTRQKMIDWLNETRKSGL